MHFDSLAEFMDMYSYVKDPAERIQLYIVGHSRQRTRMAHAVRDFLEERLLAAAQKQRVGTFGIGMIDLKNEPGDLNPLSPLHDLLRSDTITYVPIFLNASKANNLGQTLFDIGASGVLCVSPTGYRAVTNWSKRDCFDVLRTG